MLKSFAIALLAVTFFSQATLGSTAKVASRTTTSTTSGNGGGSTK